MQDYMLTNLSLLPHDGLIVIKDIIHKKNHINLMKNLLKAFQDALQHFENSMLDQFDAQVGETLCQIRAYKIYLLKTRHYPTLTLQLNELKNTIIKVNQRLELQLHEYEAFLRLHKSQRPRHLHTPITLTDFFSEIGCLITIPEDALYIFIAHFLCHYNIVDEERIPVSINYNKISKQLLLSKSYSKKLGHYYQKSLSKLSCSFMYQLLDELPGETDLKHILPQLHRSADEGRMVMPCYSVTKIILLHMINNEAKIILLVNMKSNRDHHKIAISLKGKKNTQDFELMPLHESNIMEPAIVLYGECSTDKVLCSEIFQSTLCTIGLKQIILSNNAAHSQYCGKMLKEFEHNPFQTLLKETSQQQLSLADTKSLYNLSNELVQMKKLAKTLGCTIDNHKLFLLKHIFCDTLCKYFEYNVSAKLSVPHQSVKETLISENY